MVGYLFFGILLAGILLMQSFGVFPKSSANLDQMPPVKAEYAALLVSVPQDPKPLSPGPARTITVRV